MPERDDFLKALRFNADDHTTRLVFADWLDEHGDPDLAEVYRLFVAVVRMRRPLATPEEKGQARRLAELVDRLAREVDPGPGDQPGENDLTRLSDFLPSGGGKMLHRLIGVAFLRHTPTATGRLGPVLTEGRLLKAVEVAEAFAVKEVSAAECEEAMESLVAAIGSSGGPFAFVERTAGRAAVALSDPATPPASPLTAVAKLASTAAVGASHHDRFDQSLGLIQRIYAYHVGVVARRVGRGHS
jgi:uncharacterized protein (TIGR02996 family)